jgi:uncharacterized protein (DUF58 family)
VPTDAPAPPPPAAAAPPPRGLVDTAALMKMRSLELRAKAAVEGLARGLHRSVRHGFSVEFTEYRPYTPGDDPRFLDWRVYARSDRDFVKKFEDETNLRCTLVVDHSRSMAYGSGGWTKGEYAATLAATLATFLTGQGDAVGLVTFAGDIEGYLPPRHRAGHLRRLLHALEAPPAGRASAVVPALERVAATLQRRGLLVLVSDLLAATDGLERQLGGLRVARHEVVVLQVLDRAEIDFAFEGAAHFLDLETDRRLLLDPRSARDEYRRALEAHLARIRRIADKLGIDYVLCPTDGPIDGVLVDLLARRGGPGGARAGRGSAAAPRGAP